jgi:hypothetical protein
MWINVPLIIDIVQIMNVGIIHFFQPAQAILEGF